jgi:hypothetical protein|tara:strand:- start:4263 stop:4862 length:600 start_codon:yes stop_codon:yes gene_type:complete
MNIISAFWGNKYSVDKLKKLPIDYCFSDREIPGVKTLPIDMSYRHTWKKMTLFDKRLNLGDCLFLDIDIIIQGDLNILIDYYNKNKVKGRVMLSHVHWFDNEKMKLNKSTYTSCNVNSGVYAFNNAECDHIYQSVKKNKDNLAMLFEGTDKWFYHKHPEWYSFWPDEYVQHRVHNFQDYDRNKAIIISENGSAEGRNKI